MMQRLQSMISDAFRLLRIPRVKRTGRILLATVLPLLVLVPLVAYINVMASLSKRNIAAFPIGSAVQVVPVAVTGLQASAQLPGAQVLNGVIALANITAVNPSSFQVHVEVAAAGTLAAPNDTLARLTAPIQLLVNGRAFVNPAGQPGSPIDLQLNFVSGDPNDYPFDKYVSTLTIAAVNMNTSSPIPIVLGISGAIQAWTIEFTDFSNGDKLVASQIKATRSFTTQFFSIFVVIMMWFLSITIFTLAVSVWIRDRKAEPATIAVSGSLLFSLPALRNSQPGAPVIGCTADVAGFFWNVALVTVATLILMINYISTTRNSSDTLALTIPDHLLQHPSTKDTDMVVVNHRNHHHNQVTGVGVDTSGSMDTQSTIVSEYVEVDTSNRNHNGHQPV